MDNSTNYNELLFFQEEIPGMKKNVQGRIFNLLMLAAILIVGCSKGSGTKPLPIEFDRSHACKVCGMIMVDFPGAKAQIHYKSGKYDAFCSSLDMFLFYLQPDRPTNISAIYLNDMGKAEHEHPKGHWIEAKGAFYVKGGEIMGAMGEALVPFSDIKEAAGYITKHGGKIVRFDEVTMDTLRPGR